MTPTMNHVAAAWIQRIDSTDTAYAAIPTRMPTRMPTRARGDGACVRGRQRARRAERGPSGLRETEEGESGEEEREPRRLEGLHRKPAALRQSIEERPRQERRDEDSHQDCEDTPGEDLGHREREQRAVPPAQRVEDGHVGLALVRVHRAGDREEQDRHENGHQQGEGEDHATPLEAGENFLHGALQREDRLDARDLREPLLQDVRREGRGDLRTRRASREPEQRARRLDHEIALRGAQALDDARHDGLGPLRRVGTREQRHPVACRESALDGHPAVEPQGDGVRSDRTTAPAPEGGRAGVGRSAHTRRIGPAPRASASQPSALTTGSAVPPAADPSRATDASSCGDSNRTTASSPTRCAAAVVSRS